MRNPRIELSLPEDPAERTAAVGAVLERLADAIGGEASLEDDYTGGIAWHAEWPPENGSVRRLSLVPLSPEGSVWRLDTRVDRPSFAGTRRADLLARASLALSTALGVAAGWSSHASLGAAPPLAFAVAVATTLAAFALLTALAVRWLPRPEPPSSDERTAWKARVRRVAIAQGFA